MITITVLGGLGVGTRTFVDVQIFTRYNSQVPNVLQNCTQNPKFFLILYILYFYNVIRENNKNEQIEQFSN